eukprot:GHVN01065256.1.p1 GENE.GHVN01065256.1~~GHVN01065256.1.p1  ORF type:complete len:137 (+),score=13.47 GHVN01065256.1:36-446(+)
MLCQIFGLLVMDSDGGRIAVKYTPGTQHAEFKDYLSQTKFETQLMQRSQRLAGRTDVEVVMVGDVLALFRSINDVCIFVLAEPDENAFVLLEVANEMSTVLNNITRCVDHFDSVGSLLAAVRWGNDSCLSILMRYF